VVKANRVISKPKPPPLKRVAIVDPINGVISGYASGPNIVLGDVESKRNWKDITDIPGSATLNADRIKRTFLKDGKIKKKPRVRLVVDSRKVEIDKGRAKVSYEVLEGEVDGFYLNLAIKSAGSSRCSKLRHNQELEIGGSSRCSVAITVDDPLVFVEGPVVIIGVVPAEELIKTQVPKLAPMDNMIIEKKIRR